MPNRGEIEIYILLDTQTVSRDSVLAVSDETYTGKYYLRNYWRHRS